MYLGLTLILGMSQAENLIVLFPQGKHHHFHFMDGETEAVSEGKLSAPMFMFCLLPGMKLGRNQTPRAGRAGCSLSVSAPPFLNPESGNKSVLSYLLVIGVMRMK